MLFLELLEFLFQQLPFDFSPAAVNAFALSVDLSAPLHSVRVQADVARLLAAKLKQFIANLPTVGGVQLQSNLSLFTFGTQPICQQLVQNRLADISSGTPY